jgi:hypothetical protein
VLLVVIGYRQKGGVSKSRVGEILGLEASFYLDDLLSQELIYCDPSRELNFWRPTPSALLALGLRSHTDIPALRFKQFETAAVTIRGIELAEKIKKQQFNLKPLTGKATTAPEIWAAVLVA